MIKNKFPTVLIILDGWGVAPQSLGNAISRANVPNFDALRGRYPYTTLQASGEAVGLPWGEVGNSEVGHLNLGAGKVVFQDLLRILTSIADGSFFKNKIFIEAADHVKKNKSVLHFMGLLGPGGVHADDELLYALLKLFSSLKVDKVYLHLFTDGRDSPQKEAPIYLGKLMDKMNEYHIGKIATIGGRYFAMDRNQLWDRTEKAYKALVYNEGIKTDKTPIEAIKDAYSKNETDEFVEPRILTKDGKPIAKISDNDAVIFYNFRPDRTRQLSAAFIKENFNFFPHENFKNLYFVTMTEYDREFPSHVPFPPEPGLVKNPLCKVLSEKNINQLHMAESEKYAHVTYFFNGGEEQPVKGEDRILIPSPKVATYDLKPEMSAEELTESLIKELDSDKYGFILINYANPDMVGHTGVLDAAIKACETVDSCLGRICDAILNKNGFAIVTADHGNVEQMVNLQTGKPDTEHTTNPVPFILVGSEDKFKLEGYDHSDIPSGILGDVAPTILEIMGIEKPEDMTGFSLLLK